MGNELEQVMGKLAEQLASAATQLERAMAGIEERHAHVCGDVQKIVATAEGAFGDGSRAELERKLVEAEKKIAFLEAQAARGTETSRKTAAPLPVAMVSKSGYTNPNGIEAGALDAALSGLSLEQRIAVKSQLLRAGY